MPIRSPYTHFVCETRRRSHIQLLCLWRRQFCFSLGDNRRKINQSLQKITLDHQILLQVNFVMFILTSQDEYCVKVSDSLIELPCLTWNSSFLYIWSRTRVICDEENLVLKNHYVFCKTPMHSTHASSLTLSGQPWTSKRKMIPSSGSFSFLFSFLFLMLGFFLSLQSRHTNL